mgnify:CR=1 FL=1
MEAEEAAEAEAEPEEDDVLQLTYIGPLEGDDDD